MNYIKKIIQQTTGYWLHKLSDLPVGADLFVDIHFKLKYPFIETIFDVGANIGQANRYFRYHLPEATIYSFEPVSAAFLQLQQRVQNDSGSKAVQLAMGDVPGEKLIRLHEGPLTVLNSLHDEMMNNDEHARKELIRIDTLDAYCGREGIRKIDLLKIDTEGFEIPVLKGTVQLMQQAAIPFIYCETGFQKGNKRNTYFPELTELLETYGYYFFGLYQMDYHDWRRGNHLGNALYVHQSVFPQQL